MLSRLCSKTLFHVCFTFQSLILHSCGKISGISFRYKKRNVLKASGGIPSHSNPASGSNASGMSTNISIKELGKEIAEAITSSNSKGAVSMPKFGNRSSEEIGIFLRKYEQFGTAQNWSHDDLLQTFATLAGASSIRLVRSPSPNCRMTGLTWRRVC